MLKVWVKGFQEGCIKVPNSYFNRKKKKDWFNRPDVKRIIKEVDNSIAVKDEYIESPVYGGMAPERLSSGCKCLILLLINPVCNLYASRMGDNCMPFLLEIAEKTDAIVTFHHIARFPQNMKAEFLDTGRIVKSWEEYVDEYLNITGGF